MQKSYLYISNLALVLLVGVVAIVHAPAAIRLTALIGSILLAAILLLPIINKREVASADGRLLRLRAGLDTVLRQRKQLGLWSVAWLATHAVLSVIVYFDGPQQFVRLVRQQPVTLLEISSLAILLLMAATSNNWSRLHLPGWKYIHMLVWSIPGMALVSSLLAARDTLGQLPLLGIAPVLFGLCVIAGIGAFIVNRRRQRDDWLRLGFLLAGCVAASLVWRVT